MLIRHFKDLNKIKLNKQFSPVNALIFSLFFVLFFAAQSTGGGMSKRILKLEDAYVLALKSNELIAIAEKDVDKSRLLPKKALSVMMPVVEAEGKFVEANDANKFASIVFRPKNQWHSTFKITQPVYRANYFTLKKQAGIAVSLSEDDYCFVVQNTLLKVARLYYDILKNKALYNNTVEIKKKAEEELKISKVKFEAGTVTEDAVLNSELNISRSERQLIEHKNNLQLAKDMLWSLIGIENLEYDLVEPDQPTIPTGDSELLIKKALETRYDYKIAALNLQLARYDKDLVKSRFHPKLEGGWTYDRSDEDTFNRDKELWLATVLLKVPIFEGGLRFWDLKEKQTNIAQAELALKDARRAITTEVRNIFLSVKTYKSILNNLKKRFELAQKNYEIVFAKFKFGSTTSTDMNNALVALDSAKTELVVKTYDCQFEILKLEKAIGIFAQDYINNLSW